MMVVLNTSSLSDRLDFRTTRFSFRRNLLGPCGSSGAGDGAAVLVLSAVPTAIASLPRRLNVPRVLPGVGGAGVLFACAVAAAGRRGPLAARLSVPRSGSVLAGGRRPAPPSSHFRTNAARTCRGRGAASEPPERAALSSCAPSVCSNQVTDLLLAAGRLAASASAPAPAPDSTSAAPACGATCCSMLAAGPN